jgi:hypothetical protein
MSKLSKEERSARMRRAWETRRANMAKIKGGSSSQFVRAEIPPAAVQKQISGSLEDKFFKYLDFAIDNNDSGVLSTDKFKAILTNVRPSLTIKR